MGLYTFMMKRTLTFAVTLIGAVFLIFIITRVLPGDPARLIAGPEASPEDVEAIRRQLGLDKPLHIQFAMYISSLIKGDLGTSLRRGTPVIDEILARLPYTITLAVVAEALALAIALPLGIFSALKANKGVARLVSALSVIGASMPVFWLALILIYVFSVELRLLPSFGAGTWKHLILPSVTLALFLTGNLTRITRSAILEAMSMNHVTTAVAKGLTPRKVFTRHVFRLSLIPIVTISGLQLGSLLGGAVITETVFAWPGIGSLLLEALFWRDYPLVQGIILFVVFVFVLMNLIMDIVYGFIDPRVRERTWT